MKFIIGLTIGLYLGFKIWHDDPKSQPQDEAREEEPARQKPLAMRFRADKQVTVVHEKYLAPPVAQAMKKVEGRLITLTSTTISKMEDNWRNLGQEIRLAREEDGWRITELDGNSMFAKAGFVKGDLITEKAIAKLRDTEMGADNLPERFQKILRSVTN